MKEVTMNYEEIPASKCIIEEAGQFKDEFVYDLEIGGSVVPHTFFADGILVHNSLYVRMDAVLMKLFGKFDIDWDDPETFKKIKEFVDGDFQIRLNKHVSDFCCDNFKTDERRIEFKREKISSEGDYLAKKRYAVHVRDNEGLECNSYTYIGVDIKKNELPQKVKDLLASLVTVMISKRWRGSEMIHQELNKIYEEYQNFDVNDIAYIKNVTTLKDRNVELEDCDEDLFDDSEDGFDKTFLKTVKGTGVHARAATYYNDILKKLKITDKYEQIKSGDRFHYMYIVPSNDYQLDCIGWKDKYPEEFKEIFTPDMYTMFQKTVVGPLKTFLSNHGCEYFDAHSVVNISEDGKSIFDI